MGQIEKNTVKAENQLKKSNFVTFINPQGKGKRVMFVGNSITRHGILHEIGWHNDYGMAASCIENDYVHIVAKEFTKSSPDSVFCICQVAEWERNYKKGESVLELYETAHEFEPDILIMRIVENCPRNDFNKDLFKTEYNKLISYLKPTGNAKFIITTGFWKHIADCAIREYANENGYSLVELNDLGEDESMKAIGLFDHSGVANHPGDKGMMTIAKRIMGELN